LTYVNKSTPVNLCPDTHTIAVSILKPVKPNITQVGPFCSKDAVIQLSISANTGSWTSNSYLSNTGVFSPSMASIGNNMVQYVVGTSTCNVVESKVISVEAFVPATIMKAIPDMCNNGSPQNLLPNTQSNLGTWSGPGISGTSFDPSVAGAGTFSLTYSTASSPSGLCPDQSIVAVKVFSLAPPVLNSFGPICNNSAVREIIVSPVGGMFSGANNSAVSLKGLFVPQSAVIGNNVINYSITSGPCIAYAQTTVIVEKFISADIFKTPMPMCENQQPIDMNSFVQNPGGSWQGPSIPASGSMFTPNKSNVGTVNTLTYTTHSANNTTLCPDTRTLSVEVRKIPALSIVSDFPTGCAPFQAPLHLVGANYGEGTWLFGDNGQNGEEFNTTHVYTQPGTYFVSYSWTDKVCESVAKLAVPIVVKESPKADFVIPEEVLITQPSIQLTNISTILNNNQYSWRLNGEPVASGEVNATLRFEKTGKQRVTLIAKSVGNCIDSVSKTIEVRNDFNIYIPTSFTPNDDGLNDYFMPKFSPDGLDEKTFDMEIFDRWGHSMFHSKNPNSGWNGMFKGEPMKEEVYIYRIKFRDAEGNVYNKMGPVTLIR